MLLTWSQSFPNFQNVSATKHWFGWTNDTMAVPCTWTGVACASQCLDINLADQGLHGEASAHALLPACPAGLTAVTASPPDHCAPLPEVTLLIRMMTAYGDE